jgi:nucleoside-diphosphate-sugar epimerase
MFFAAVQGEEYRCFVNEETTLPMIYTDDTIRATLMIMDADPDKINSRTSYNIAAVSFCPKELAKEIQKHLPLKVIYVPDDRQKIADSWPKTIDDHWARADWGWQPKFDLAKMVEVMIDNLKKKFSI